MKSNEEYLEFAKGVARGEIVKVFREKLGKEMEV